MKAQEILKLEEKACFDFFINEMSQKSETYGLILDNTRNKEVSSIASVGFGLSSLPVGVEKGWIKKIDAKNIAEKTLKTFARNIEHKNGFYYHFLNMHTGERMWKSEVSIIDTALFLMGALTSGEYFGGDVYELFEEIYSRVNWPWYLNKEQNQFYMGYSDERGFWGAWDHYAEQLVVYFLSVASPTYSVDVSVYDSFERFWGEYNGIKHIYTYVGAIFTYQFSHAWIDFRTWKDKYNVNWFENSVNASKTNWNYCKDNSNVFKTFSEVSWGLSACDSPKGYKGCFGALPAMEFKNDGTIPPYGAIGSIVFVPDLVFPTVLNYFNNYPELWGKYGFKDAYNLDENWFSNVYIGIDKGISLLMIENHFSELIWKIVNQNKYIKKAFKLLNFESEKIQKK